MNSEMGNQRCNVEHNEIAQWYALHMHIHMGDRIMLFQAATYRHYKTIRLRPEKFTSYLTNNVGFSSYRMLTHTGTKSMYPHTKTGQLVDTGMNDQSAATDTFSSLLGNHRPIYLFHKGPAPKKWANRQQSATDRKWDFALSLCMLSAREKSCRLPVPRVNLHFDWQAWNDITTVQPTWLHCERLCHLWWMSGVKHMSDPKHTVFENAIGLFDCKIKVFEYETTDVKLLSFVSFVKTVQVPHHTLNYFVLSPL